MESIKHVLMYPLFGGVPVWNFALMSVIFPLLNELIARNPKWRAQSFLQAIGNVFSSPPLSQIPIVAQALMVFTVFRTKQPPALDGAEVVARKAGQ